jgi:hypothetical protein
MSSSNLLLDSPLQQEPQCFFVDEGHHSVLSTEDQLKARAIGEKCAKTILKTFAKHPDLFTPSRERSLDKMRERITKKIHREPASYTMREEIKLACFDKLTKAELGHYCRGFRNLFKSPEDRVSDAAYIVLIGKAHTLTDIIDTACDHTLAMNPMFDMVAEEAAYPYPTVSAWEEEEDARVATTDSSPAIMGPNDSGISTATAASKPPTRFASPDPTSGLNTPFDEPLYEYDATLGLDLPGSTNRSSPNSVNA